METQVNRQARKNVEKLKTQFATFPFTTLFRRAASCGGRVRGPLARRHPENAINGEVFGGTMVGLHKTDSRQRKNSANCLDSSSSP